MAAALDSVVGVVVAGVAAAETEALSSAVGRGMLVSLSSLFSAVSDPAAGRGISVGSLAFGSGFSFTGSTLIGDLRRWRLRILLRDRDLLLEERELYRDLECERERVRERE